MYDDIFSDIYQIIEVEVGAEWLVFRKNVVQCTPCNLAGFVCRRWVSSDGKCVFNVVHKL